jgi:hypothetical protein
MQYYKVFIKCTTGGDNVAEAVGEVDDVIIILGYTHEA